MSYNPAALTSAMSKSIYFENIIDNSINTCFKIGSFDNEGFYKLTLTTNNTSLIIEHSQGRIISVQSISSFYPKPNTMTLENYVNQDITLGLRPFYINIINNDDSYDLYVEGFINNTEPEKIFYASDNGKWAYYYTDDNGVLQQGETEFDVEDQINIPYSDRDDNNNLKWFINTENGIKELRNAKESAIDNAAKHISINIEYTNGNFLLDPSVQGSFKILLNNKNDNNNVRLFYFNTTQYDIGLVTSSFTSKSIKVEKVTADSISVKNMRLGDWVFSVDDTDGPNKGKLTLSIDPLQDQKGEL